MNIGVCEMFFDSALACQAGYVILWGMLLVGIGYAICRGVYTLFMAVISTKKVCPKCKNGILKEKAFTDQVPTTGPHGMGIYRRFY